MLNLTPIICYFLLFVGTASCGLLDFVSSSEPKHRQLNRRVGPFFYQQKPVGNSRSQHHPYLQRQPTHQWSQSQEQFSSFEDVPSHLSSQGSVESSVLQSRHSPIIERTPTPKVLMPIISSGYASTKIQGGRYGVSETKKKEKKKKQPEAQEKVFTNNLESKTEESDVEQAIVEEIAPETTSTTASTTTTVRTPTTVSTPAPQILIIEEVVQKSGEKVPTVEEVVIEEVPSPGVDSSPYFPDIPDAVAVVATEDVSQKYDVDRIDVDITPSDPDLYRPPPRVVVQQGKGSVESVPLFDEAPVEDDSAELIIEPGEDVPLDVDSGQYVRFIATPPKHVNVMVPSVHTKTATKQTNLNVDGEGYYKPPKYEPTDTYQAGYQQIDFAQTGGRFPASVNPELIDPNDYHEDRPSFSSGTSQQATQEYYPLGKPPPITPVTENLSGVASPQPEPAKESSTSFLDFLIPSFMRGSSSKADPEGPPQRPPAKAVHKPRLPQPVRLPNTFPRPHELGGKDNPIRVQIGPDGIPKLPPPPGWTRPHDVLSKRKMYRIEQDIPERAILVEQTPDPASINMEDQLFVEVPVSQELELGANPRIEMPRLPPRLPPMMHKMHTTAKPFISLPKITFERKPLAGEPMVLRRRQLGEDRLIPDQPEFTSLHQNGNDDASQGFLNTEEYKTKLSDPEFYQTITKAHVFHATDLDNGDTLQLDEPDSEAPVQYSPNVFQIQDLNPFGEKPFSQISKQNQLEIEAEPLEQKAALPTSPLVMMPRLEDIAPPSRSSHHSASSGVERPEVVYQPTDVYGNDLKSNFAPKIKNYSDLIYDQAEIHESDSEPVDDMTVPEDTTDTQVATESTTDNNEDDDFESSTEPIVDPIAAHVNKLLKHYLTTEKPLKDAPSLVFDETGNVVLEYLSPEGELGRVPQPIQPIEDFQTYQAVPEPHQSLDAFDPEKDYIHFDEVFVPSSMVRESDWFVTDDKGTRMKHKEAEDRLDMQDVEEVHDEVEEDTTLPTDTETETIPPEMLEDETISPLAERQAEGGFQPVAGTSDTQSQNKKLHQT